MKDDQTFSLSIYERSRNVAPSQHRGVRSCADTAIMGLSKSTRIMILLAIDTAFFFLELVVGYAVHSLALVADSFHMVCWLTDSTLRLILTASSSTMSYHS